MDLNKLFHLSTELSTRETYINKYTYWGVTQKLQNYRMVTLGTLMTYARQTSEEVPDYLIRFVNEQKRVLAISNIIAGIVTQTVLRSLHEHAFITLTSSHQFPYGLGQVPLTHSYLDPIVLTEGTIDRDVLASIYPHCIACLTSGLSSLNLAILPLITCHAVLAYDNDETGDKAFRRDRYKLSQQGIRVSRLPHPTGFKDPGDLAQLYLTQQSREALLALTSYKVTLSRILERSF